jgi:type VI secretion system secreted protein Hcp
MASDFLLEIDGIKGESNDSKHKETIDIESFSWGATQPGTFATGGGGGAGKVSFQDIHFVSNVNKASPKLINACATGQHIKKATLFVRKAGGKQEDYYTVTLEDVLVSSYQSGGSNHSNAVPTDQFSLNFAKIKYEYKPQDAKGGLAGAVPFSYDLKANKAG